MARECLISCRVYKIASKSWRVTGRREEGKEGEEGERVEGRRRGDNRRRRKDSQLSDVKLGMKG